MSSKTIVIARSGLSFQRYQLSTDDQTSGSDEVHDHVGGKSLPSRPASEAGAGIAPYRVIGTL